MAFEIAEKGQTLLDNWYEERECKAYDKGLTNAKVLRNGHFGLITTNTNKSDFLTTTVQETYTKPRPETVKVVGPRKELKVEYLSKQVLKELQESKKPPPFTQEYKSMRHDYYKEFDGSWPEPKHHHDLLKEQPETYWKDTVSKGLQGMTQITAPGSVFKKNAAFSTPIELSMDKPVPYININVETAEIPQK